MKYFSKIKSLVLVSTAALAMSSCGDFLTIEPRTFVSEDNFWNEKTDVDQMVTGVYTSMQEQGFVERLFMWGEVRSENVTGGLNYSGNMSVYRVLKENLLSNNYYTDWATFYSIINKCNIIIEKAPKVSEMDPTYTASDVRATIAEMSFIRDLCYFYLVRTFKDVPFRTQAVTEDSQTSDLPATDGDEIVRWCIADLEGVVNDALRAYPKDSNSKFNSNCNRVTQNAINALIADLCLWDNQYQKCSTYCQKVIDAKVKQYSDDYSNTIGVSGNKPTLFQYQGGSYVGENYPLYPCFNGNSGTYGANYCQIFGEENSFESIFELDFNYDGSDNNYRTNGAISWLYGGYTTTDRDGYGILGVPENTVTDLTQQTYRVYDHKYDVRFYTDIRPTDDQYTKAYVGKYVAGKNTTISLASSAQLPFSTSFDKTNINANRNVVFYRLSDVMLMQAEALVELGSENMELSTTDTLGNEVKVFDENLQKAFSLVWTVNRRSIMTNSAVATTTYALNINDYKDKSKLRELVQKERRRELMFEGKRWFDILRRCHRDGNTNYAKSNVPGKLSSGGATTLFVNYESLYWPYNKNEVKTNKNLDQKPFYGSADGDDEYEKTNK